MEFSELKNKEIFQRFAKNKACSDGKLKNILDYHDDVVFIWDKSLNCILTQGTRSICTTVQELFPTEHPEFEVTNLCINPNGSKAALWGANGVAVMDLPWRCGSRLEFQDGKENILSKCRTLNNFELGYGCEIVQVRWHPAEDSSLILLVSNNSLYTIDLVPGQSVETVRLGVIPTSRQRTLAALGEVAVDFCFIPAKEETALSMLVLRGNGDVHLVFGGSHADEGQLLAISPLPDDNYLSDACAILCIPGKPTAVVLATTRGVIYHALLIPSDVDQLEVSPSERKYKLLTVESVLLDFGFLAPQDDLTVFPLRVIPDPSHSRRYLVIHPSGVHSVFLETLTSVEGLLTSYVTDSLAPVKIERSMLEYLVCTSEPLQGCVAFPYTLLTIDSRNEVITVPLRRIELPPFQLFTPDESNNKEHGPLTRQLRQPFEQQIHQLLQESRVLPQIQSLKQELTKEQHLALVVRIGNLVRKVTVPKHREVRSILNQRFQLIRTLHALQVQELIRLESEKTAIQQTAEQFAERIQTVSDDMEDQRERVQVVVRKVADAYPAPTDAELRMLSTVSEVEGKLEEYSKRLEALKKDIAYQDSKIVAPERRDYVLNNKQASTIHSCLSVIGENIKELVSRINEMNDSLGVDSQL